MITQTLKEAIENGIGDLKIIGEINSGLIENQVIDFLSQKFTAAMLEIDNTKDLEKLFREVSRK